MVLLLFFVNPCYNLNDVLMESVSDVVGQRVREVRRKQGLSGADLATRCASLGMPHLSAATISNLETGRRDDEGRRRRNITVDEWLTLAVALNVAPVHLLVPIDDERGRRHMDVAPMLPLPVDAVRAWVRGEYALSDDRMYYTEVPSTEWRGPDLGPQGWLRWAGSKADIRVPDEARENQDEMGDVDNG